MRQIEQGRKFTPEVEKAWREVRLELIGRTKDMTRKEELASSFEGINRLVSDSRLAGVMKETAKDVASMPKWQRDLMKKELARL